MILEVLLRVCDNRLDVVCLLVGVCLVYRYFIIKGGRKSLPHPPGPMPLPVVGNILDMPKSTEGAHFASYGVRYGAFERPACDRRLTILF